MKEQLCWDSIHTWEIYTEVKYTWCHCANVLPLETINLVLKYPKMTKSEMTSTQSSECSDIICMPPMSDIKVCAFDFTVDEVMAADEGSNDKKEPTTDGK